MKKLGLVALFGIVLAAGCVWGYLVHRNKVFPYWLLRRAATEEPPRVETPPASPATSTLLSIPYISAARTADPELRGVVLHERGAHDGVNFYSSPKPNQNRAYLIDMDGKVLHRWQFPRRGRETQSKHWVHSELLPNGDVIVVLSEEALIRANASSEVLWEVTLPVHHDFWIDKSSGDIWALTHRPVLVPEIHPAIPALTDFITIVRPDGTIAREISILDSLLRSPYRYLLPRLQQLPFPKETREINLLHANHIEVADGKVLMTLRNMNAVVMLDAASGDVLWLWGPSNLTAPHHPTFQKSGTILLFNNGLSASEVLEVDPKTNVVTWRYAPREGFFSLSRGSAQRLANGNTLITESDRGTVFEVTPGGKTVWKFLNPDVNERSERAVIWRMTRYRRDELPFLK